ncbi:MAG: S24 family peptidase [Coprobacillus sp.]
MDIKNILKTKRKQLGLTMKEVAIACDVSEATVSRWESGDIGDMKRSRISALANVLQISPSVIVGYADDEDIYTQINISYMKVPLYGDISCGNGSFVDDNVIDYIAVPEEGLNSNKEYFAQIASGDSMIDAGINDGDVIVFEKSNVIEDGKIGCFCIDDNVATCKKFKKGKAFIQLIPANHNYDPIVIDLQDKNFRVIGILKKSIKSFV